MRGTLRGPWALVTSLALHGGGLWAGMLVVGSASPPLPHAIPVELRDLAQVPAAPRPRPQQPEPQRERTAPAPAQVRAAAQPRPPQVPPSGPAPEAIAPASASAPVQVAAEAPPAGDGGEALLAVASSSCDCAEATSSAPVAVASEAVVRASSETYLGLVLAMIEGQVEYPLQARRMRWAGKSVVRCAVARDGAIEEVEVETSSGYSLLDAAAVRAIQRVSHFPPLPEAIAGDKAFFSVPVTFRLTN